jgi:RND family efflux transporter MFP subunit
MQTMSSRSNRGRLCKGALILGALLCASADWNPGRAADGDHPAEAGVTRALPAGVTGFTAPSRTVTLAAVCTGRIAEILAEEGAFVSNGAVVVRLDDAVQRRRVEIAAALAESSLEIDLATVHLQQTQADLTRLRGMTHLSAATTKELIDAETETRAAELNLAQAQFRQTQAARELALQKALLDDMEVRAPFAGYVTGRLREVGDTVEDRQPMMTLVQLDPLAVLLDCPIDAAADLHTGMRAELRPAAGFGPPRVGEVVFVNPVGDAASQTLRVKIHVANGDAAWKAGMRVNVNFNPEPTLAADAVDGGERR